MITNSHLILLLRHRLEGEVLQVVVEQDHRRERFGDRPDPRNDRGIAAGDGSQDLWFVSPSNPRQRLPNRNTPSTRFRWKTRTWLPSPAAIHDRSADLAGRRSVHGDDPARPLPATPRLPVDVEEVGSDANSWNHLVGADRAEVTSKHHLARREVEEVFAGKLQYRHLERGRIGGEDVYAAYGRTEAGRYVTAIFILKLNRWR